MFMPVHCVFGGMTVAVAFTMLFVLPPVHL